MPSSDIRLAARIAIVGVWLAAAVTVPAACSRSAKPDPAKGTWSLHCRSEGSGDTTGNQSVSAVRKIAETGPLYSLLASASPATACTISMDESRIAITYTFDTGGTLNVVSDPRIEYTNLEAGFVSVQVPDAVDVLKQVERSVFSGGCGIDWTKSEAEAGGNTGAVRETIYRGETCNCQTRIGRNASGQVVSLAFRSAC